MLFVLLLYFISFYNLKEYLKAIPDYSRALEFNPEYAWAYWNRGNAYMSLKNFNKKAFGDYYQAGLLFIEQKNKSQALKCVEQMKKIEPSNFLINVLEDKIKLLN